MSKQPSPEVKAILKEWCAQQQAKYEPEWKSILAKEMAEKTKPSSLSERVSIFDLL